MISSKPLVSPGVPRELTKQLRCVRLGHLTRKTRSRLETFWFTRMKWETTGNQRHMANKTWTRTTWFSTGAASRTSLSSALSLCSALHLCYPATTFPGATPAAALASIQSLPTSFLTETTQIFGKNVKKINNYWQKSTMTTVNSNSCQLLFMMAWWVQW